MKTFIDYLVENIEQNLYSFVIRIAGEMPKDGDEKMKSALEKCRIIKFTKVKTTPIQQKLKDFPTIENSEVHIFNVDLEYPTTSPTVLGQLASALEMPTTRIVVHTDREDLDYTSDTQPTEKPENYHPLLNKDYDKSEPARLVGQDRVTDFLKELEVTRKKQEKKPYTGVNDNLFGKMPPVEKEEKMPEITSIKSLFTSATSKDTK